MPADYMPAEQFYVEENAVGIVEGPNGFELDGGSIFYELHENGTIYFGRATYKAPQGGANEGLDPVRAAEDYFKANVDTSEFDIPGINLVEHWDGEPRHIARGPFKGVADSESQATLHEVVRDLLYYPKPAFRDDPSFATFGACADQP